MHMSKTLREFSANSDYLFDPAIKLDMAEKGKTMQVIFLNVVLFEVVKEDAKLQPAGR